MIGFLKKLMGKSAPEPVPAAPPRPMPAPPPPAARAPLPTPARPAEPVAPNASKVVMPQVSSRPAAPAPIPAPVPPPAAAPVGPTAPTPAPPTEPRSYSGATIDLPLRALWPKLNPAVTQTATGHPDNGAELKLPVELVEPMLARGAVKIRYADLRQFAPGSLFPVLPGKETLEVEIPLAEILTRLKPEQLARRPQKKIEIPEEIGTIFGTGGAELRVAEAKAKSAPATPAAPAAPAPPAAAPVIPEPPAAIRLPQAVPVVPPPPAAPAPVAPIIPAIPLPAMAPPTPAVSEPIRAPKLDPALATLKPKMEAAPAPTVPAAAVKPGVFTLALVEVAPAWAAAGKIELAPLADHSAEIPAEAIESALKKGKLVFSWRELRAWIVPGGTLPALNDEQPVELPLAVVAPKYLQQRGLSAPRKRVQVADDIPELFAQKQAASAPAAPAAAAPTPAPPALPVPPPGAAAARPALDFGEIFGQPEKKSWTFPEITQKTAALRGVAGALIATSDGLLIAGTWPEGVKPESVAAFIPQMYSRMVQCTKELKLGEPGNFTLLVENVPLQIFRAGGNCFAVLGRVGENLPKAQLTALAMRLAMTQPAK